jgi:predicted MFS family arabinose efflux permease
MARVLRAALPSVAAVLTSPRNVRSLPMFESRWLALALIFVDRFAFGFQFQSVGSVAPFLVRDFGIDFIQIGTLVGLYLLPGAFIAIPGTLIGRRFGDKRVMLGGIALMVAGGIIAGAASTYGMLTAGRLVSGIGASFLVIMASKMIADWFSGKELVFAMSVNIVGWPMGVAAGQAFQTGVAESHSWSVVFDATSLLLLCAWLAMAVLYRDAPVVARPPEKTHGLSRREFGMVCLAGAIWMLVNAAYLVIVTFGPTLLIEHGTAISDAGFAISLYSWVAMIALPLGAYLVTKYGVSDPVMILGLLASVAASALLPFFTAAPQLLLVLLGIAFSLALPVISTLPAQLIAPENRAMGFGIYFIWFYAGTPLLTAAGGWLKDRLGTAEFSVFFASAMIALAVGLLFVLRYLQARHARGLMERASAAPASRGA